MFKCGGRKILKVSSFGDKEFGRIARVKGIEILKRLRPTPGIK